MKQYIVGRRGDEPSRTISKREAAINALVAMVPDPGPKGLQWKRRGQDSYRTVDNRPELKDALMRVKLDLGEAVFARRTDGLIVFQLTAIDVHENIAPYPYSVGTAGVKILWDDIQLELGEINQRTGRHYRFVCQGVYNCRFIDGTTTWSQHAWENAIDGHLVDEKGNFVKDVTTQLVNGVRNRGHAAETLWQVAGHYDHAHWTGEPKRFGTPPCA